MRKVLAALVAAAAVAAVVVAGVGTASAGEGRPGPSHVVYTPPPLQHFPGRGLPVPASPTFAP